MGKPHLQRASRRWSTAARWPLGVTLATWRYLWSITPVHRWEMTGSWPADAPPSLPADTDSELQSFEDGVGPLMHRIYRTRIAGSTLTPERLMGRMTANLDGVAPSEFATFQKVEGEKGELDEGNRYVVRMPGPWDGPVRVVEADATSFRLATLPGHLEAGQIEFRARSDYRSIWFEIESWARSGDRLSDLMYSRLRLSKEVQLHMWSSVLRRVVGLTGGEMEGGIVITTRVVEADSLPGAREDGRPGRRTRARVAALADRRVNFDDTKTEAYASEPGWHLDDMVEALPHERPGPPAEEESWRVAREIMDSYQLADPGVVTASYDRNLPLSGRDMLLRIRFAALRLRVGVRIGDVYEEIREVDGRAVQVFGWSYSTLEGHFEEGQMHYELWKWQDSGNVEFHLRAISRAAREGPLLLRTGFRLFGRSRQLRFYRQVCRRIRRLTEAQLETERAASAR